MLSFMGLKKDKPMFISHGSPSCMKMNMSLHLVDQPQIGPQFAKYVKVAHFLFVVEVIRYRGASPSRLLNQGNCLGAIPSHGLALPCCSQSWRVGWPCPARQKGPCRDLQVPLLRSNTAPSPTAALLPAGLSWPVEHQDHGDGAHQEAKVLCSGAPIFARPGNAWSPSHFPPPRCLGLV